MPKRSSKPPRDVNVAAKRLLDRVTGENRAPAADPAKNPAAVALGSLGGKKGGAARAAKLTPEQRADIARVAATARWKKKD
jgi:hypothetical protein